MITQSTQNSMLNVNIYIYIYIKRERNETIVGSKKYLRLISLN